ncbi:MAG TPA: PilT/PilU family type 4a pilus ATPase [Firmicutes bacterium]|nr:PilT/PilU family type 4a pilus ATPase [Bacillota bacterium]
MGLDLETLLITAFHSGASDLHLVTGAPPTLRVAGRLTRLNYPALEEANVHEALELLQEKCKEERRLRNVAECRDMNCDIPGVCRLRVHVFWETGRPAITIRFIPERVPLPEELGLPDTLMTMCQRPGILLVTGPTGSGKSTTLAALVRWALETKGLRVVTIEDPCEYRFSHFRGIVSQKQVGLDCESFHRGVIEALREDPDVIVLGELRDPESADAALLASETGHLVLATMHTPTAARTLDRFVDLFPAGRQEFTKNSLSRALNGVFAQRLLPRANGEGRVLAYELLVATPAVRNLIRKGEYQQVVSVIQAGKQLGMITMADYVKGLVQRGVVAPEQAISEVEEFE